MTQAIAQLLALRRMREQQAAAQLQSVVARHRQQQDLLAEMKVREQETAVAVASRIAELYRLCVNDRLSRGDLDLLAAKVNGQYLLEAEMHAAVAGAGKTLAAMAVDVDAARRLLLDRSRNVQKLDLIQDNLRMAAERAAEIAAEAEAERPAAPAAQFLSPQEAAFP